MVRAAVVAALAALTAPAGAIRQLEPRRQAAPECTSPLLESRPQGEKLVYFVRHAEAKHNLPGLKGALATMYETDVDLTSTGELTAKRISRDPLLAAALSHNESARVQLIISSPLRRAMRTALDAFGGAEPPIPLEFDADLREKGNHQAHLGDRGKGATMLRELHQTDLMVKYLRLPEGWTNSSYPEETETMNKRFQQFTKTLLARPEQRIIVVSHGRIMEHNLGLKPDNCAVLPFGLSAEGAWRSLVPSQCLSLEP